MKRRSIGPSVSFFAFQDIITAVVGIFILITLILVLELTQRVEAASGPPIANIDEITSSIASLHKEIERLTLEYERRIEQQADSADINNFNRAGKLEEMKSALRAAKEHLATVEAQGTQTDTRLKEEERRKSKLLRESQELEGQRERIADLSQQLDQLDRVTNRLKSEDGLIYRDETGEGRYLCLLVLEAAGLELKDAGTETVRRFPVRDGIKAFERWLEQTDINSRHFLLLVHPSGASDFDRVRDLLAVRNCVYGFDLVGEDHTVQLSFEWETKR